MDTRQQQQQQKQKHHARTNNDDGKIQILQEKHTRHEATRTRGQIGQKSRTRTEEQKIPTRYRDRSQEADLIPSRVVVVVVVEKKERRLLLLSVDSFLFFPQSIIFLKLETLAQHFPSVFFLLFSAPTPPPSLRRAIVRREERREGAGWRCQIFTRTWIRCASNRM